MKIPKPLAALIEAFVKLPGIGPKTAQRLTYYLLHVPQSELTAFADALLNLKSQTKVCSICKNIGEQDPCSICADSRRDSSLLLVVEQPLDVLAFERMGSFDGLYHVLHGAINPLENIGPDELYLNSLFERLKNGTPVKELIVATNPTMEGEATAMYISRQLQQRRLKIELTRLGRGVPTGADIEHADETTLKEALVSRRMFDHG